MFNKSQILKEAHAATKQLVAGPFYAGMTYAQIFAGQLRRVWRQAKEKARTTQPADTIRNAIIALECKDRWTRADYASMGKLRAELREAA